MSLTANPSRGGGAKPGISPRPPVAVLVRASHERWDGKGYPDGVAGDRIPLGARIIAACDAYGAMTSDRVYRARRDHAAACRELLSEAGRQFDPGVIDALLEELGTLRVRGTAPRPAVTTPDPSVQKPRKSSRRCSSSRATRRRACAQRRARTDRRLGLRRCRGVRPADLCSWVLSPLASWVERTRAGGIGDHVSAASA